MHFELLKVNISYPYLGTRLTVTAVWRDSAGTRDQEAGDEHDLAQPDLAIRVV